MRKIVCILALFALAVGFGVSGTPAGAEPLRLAAAQSGIFPVTQPQRPRNASPVQTAANGQCDCHEGCEKIFHDCQARNGNDCFKTQQRCWMVCNKNYPECRKD